MRKRYCILAAILLAGAAQGGILPEGSYIWQIRGYWKGHLRFFDEARVIPWNDYDGTVHDEKAWVSRYGVLNGGTLFDTDLFSLDPTTEATFHWDFGDTGYLLRYLVINNATSDPTTRIYNFQGRDMLAGDITVSGWHQGVIWDISVYGKIPGQSLPDAGDSIGLLAIGIGIVALFKIGRGRHEKSA